MTFVTTHERPGVYSVYEAAAAVTASSRSGTAAIAAQSAGGTAGTLYTLTSDRQAAAAFGQERLRCWRCRWQARRTMPPPSSC